MRLSKKLFIVVAIFFGIANFNCFAQKNIANKAKILRSDFVNEQNLIDGKPTCAHRTVEVGFKYYVEIDLQSIEKVKEVQIISGECKDLKPCIIHVRTAKQNKPEEYSLTGQLKSTKELKDDNWSFTIDKRIRFINLELIMCNGDYGMDYLYLEEIKILK